MLGTKTQLRQAAVAVLSALLVACAASSPPARAEAPPPGKGAVAGAVRMPDGSAASGVIVRLVERDVSGRAAGEASPGPRKKGKAKGRAQQSAATATTAPDGTFTLKDVAAGRYAIQAAVKGEAAARQFVTVRPNEVARVTLTLEKGGGKRGAGRDDRDDRRSNPARRKPGAAQRKRQR